MAWEEKAACRVTDPELFFPSRGGSAWAKRAKSVCRVCDVSTDCLDDALERKERFGIWGGMTARERRRMLKAASAHA